MVNADVGFNLAEHAQDASPGLPIRLFLEETLPRFVRSYLVTPPSAMTTPPTGVGQLRAPPVTTAGDAIGPVS
jgi:hypothetical protein